MSPTVLQESKRRMVACSQEDADLPVLDPWEAVKNI